MFAHTSTGLGLQECIRAFTSNMLTALRLTVRAAATRVTGGKKPRDPLWLAAQSSRNKGKGKHKGKRTVLMHAARSGRIEIATSLLDL